MKSITYFDMITNHINEPFFVRYHYPKFQKIFIFDTFQGFLDSINSGDLSEIYFDAIKCSHPVVYDDALGFGFEIRKLRNFDF